MSRAAIQTAFYNAISGNMGVISTGATVQDIGPRVDDASQSFPYVTIGDANLAEYDTDQERGFDVALRVHTYSDAGALLECAQIQDAVYNALHLTTPAVVGFRCILCYREDSGISQTSSGAIHGVCDYRAIILEE